ncbi:hypothetical protein ACFUVV_01205 [Streptomyces sp. NPDC057376]|uniref:hypothetical protein n=1 Tax=Streptomyces sp. NPDC057376 TaxID=3346110 RepID=UPI00363AAC37
MAYEPWQPGMVLTASRLASISPTWQAWTPTWTTVSGEALPAFGDASIDCAYAVSARTVFWRFDVAFGAGTNFGSGPDATDNWLFSVPVPAAAVIQPIGWMDLAASGTARSVARARLITTGDFGLEIVSGQPSGAAIANTGLVDSVSPWTWTAGMSLRGGGQYEAA